MLILIITIITLIFGIIAYFLYKTREKKRAKNKKVLTYDEAIHEIGDEYIFFE
jgi:heme/copper-type cytochrome/quinol oxidase subunit 2